MTKQQKARAHIARAQELLNEQGTLAFGAPTAVCSAPTYSDLPKQVLSQILIQAENATGERLMVLRAVGRIHREIIENMLRNRAQDDQFLVNALQDHDHDLAHLLLQHRPNTLDIPKDSIHKINRTVNSTGSYAMLMTKILQGALEQESTIKLRLNPPYSTNSYSYALITERKDNYRFRTEWIKSEDPFTHEKGQVVYIGLSDRWEDEVVYIVDGRLYYGEITLIPLKSMAQSQ